MTLVSASPGAHTIYTDPITQRDAHLTTIVTTKGIKIEDYGIGTVDVNEPRTTRIDIKHVYTNLKSAKSWKKTFETRIKLKMQSLKKMEKNLAFADAEKRKKIAKTIDRGKIQLKRMKNSLSIAKKEVLYWEKKGIFWF